MQYDLEYVRMMMMEKISGTLEESEDKVLQQLIREDATIAGLWEKLEVSMAEPAAADIIKGLPGRQERVWANVDERVRGREWVTGEEPTDGEESIAADKAKHPVRRFPLARIAAAACFLLLAAGGGFYYRSVHRGAPLASGASSSAVPSIKRSIQLQLAGGRPIDLSAAGNIINLQEAQLKNANKTLSFQATEGKAAGLNTLTVPVGMDYKIVLADSTEVWMNSATVLQFPFAFRGNTREISLSGEAYLKVAANPSKPFIVHMPHASIEVLGTAFNVNSYDSGIVRVSLMNGAVKLKSDNKEIVLRPGMEGVCSESAATSADFSLHSFDEKDVLSWMHGIHVFYNASIQEISTVLPRWYGIAVVLDNSNIARERFSGFIDRNKPIQDFLENLKSTNSADYYFKGETLHLK